MKIKVDKNEILISESFRVSDLKEILKLLPNETESRARYKIKIDNNCEISDLSMLCIKSTINSTNLILPNNKNLKLPTFTTNDQNLKKQDLLEKIGRLGISLAKEISSIASFLNQTIKEFFIIVKEPKKLRTREIIAQIDHCGYFAIGIVSLLTFLIGVVIAYLMGNQLQYYGANIFVVDGVVASMCRELSPILVAIVVAGRSGSAFAAQLGSMKSNQEIDALEAMGVRTFQILVLPRILALIISLPFLVILGDIFGILGGMFISNIHLGISYENFIERIYMVLKPKQIIVGLIKAPLFALFISAIGCKLGLEAEPNSVSIGNNTTKTVVQSIVSVILLNAIAAIIFSNLGI